jgi:hypothetical protein
MTRVIRVTDEYNDQRVLRMIRVTRLTFEISGQINPE